MSQLVNVLLVSLGVACCIPFSAPGGYAAQGQDQSTTEGSRVQARVRLADYLKITDLHEMIRIPLQWRHTLPEDEQKALLVALIEKLRSTRELELANYAATFVISRVESGKMKFPGHGEELEQDVFLENGRCALAIEFLLGCRLPVFTEAVGKDPKLLHDYARQSCFRVIEAMAMPRARDPEPKPESQGTSQEQLYRSEPPPPERPGDRP